MNAFTRVEKVLAFHHTTTKSPMMLKDLINKADISLQDAKELLASWSAGYKAMRIGSQEYVEASEVPMNLQARQERFKREYKHKSAVMPMRSVTNLVSRPKIQKKSAAVPKRAMSMDQILQKVLQKQAQAQQTSERKDQVRRDFLVAQVPVVEGVLRSLASFSRSLSLAEVIRKVQASARSSLDVEEIEQILSKIDFVRIIDAGGVKCIQVNESSAGTAHQFAIKA